MSYRAFQQKGQPREENDSGKFFLSFRGCNSLSLSLPLSPLDLVPKTKKGPRRPALPYQVTMITWVHDSSLKCLLQVRDVDHHSRLRVNLEGERGRSE